MYRWILLLFAIILVAQCEEGGKNFRGRITEDLSHDEIISRMREIVRRKSSAAAERVMAKKNGKEESPNATSTEKIKLEASKLLDDSAKSNNWGINESESAKGKQAPQLLDLWDGEKCEDLESESACTAVQPMCKILGETAFKYCRKTCEFCPENEPKKTLVANVDSVKGTISLTQLSPGSSVFMSACFGKETIDEQTLWKVTIHEPSDGENCSDIGEPYDPYGNSLGVLGEYKFGSEQLYPLEKCGDEMHYLAATVSNNIRLWSSDAANPNLRSVVLTDVKNGSTIGCGILREPNQLKKNETGSANEDKEDVTTSAEKKEVGTGTYAEFKGDEIKELTPETSAEKKENATSDKKTDLTSDKKIDLKSDKKADLTSDKKIDLTSGTSAEKKENATSDKKTDLTSDEKTDLTSDKKTDLTSDKKIDLTSGTKDEKKAVTSGQNNVGATETEEVTAKMEVTGVSAGNTTTELLGEAVFSKGTSEDAKSGTTTAAPEKDGKGEGTESTTKKEGASKLAELFGKVV